MDGWPKICLQRKISYSPPLYHFMETYKEYKETYVITPVASRWHSGIIFLIIAQEALPFPLKMQRQAGLLLGSQAVSKVANTIVLP